MWRGRSDSCHAGGRSFFFMSMHVRTGRTFILELRVPSVAGWLRSRASLWGDGLMWTPPSLSVRILFSPVMRLLRWCWFNITNIGWQHSLTVQCIFANNRQRGVTRNTLILAPEREREPLACLRWCRRCLLMIRSLFARNNSPWLMVAA